MNHEERMIDHAGGWQQSTGRCVCGKLWPCPAAALISKPSPQSPENRIQAALDAATKPLHAEIEQLKKDRDKAIRTLQIGGYTDFGGELWKPPLGKAPDFEKVDATTLDQLRRIDRAARHYVDNPGHGNFSRLRDALYDGRASGDKPRKAVRGDIMPPLWIPAPDWRELLQRCVEGWQEGADVAGPMFSAINALKSQWSPYHPDPYGKTHKPPHCRTCACGLVPDLSIISVTAVRIAAEFRARANSAKKGEAFVSGRLNGMSVYNALHWMADEVLRIFGSSKELDATSEFKNFHRLLCERFGYVHDEKDWRRDQLSLIEHIAKCRLDAEYEQIGVLNYSYEGFTTYEGASGEPVYRKRKAP
jgi:hypothetical protein